MPVCVSIYLHSSLCLPVTRDGILHFPSLASMNISVDGTEPESVRWADRMMAF